MAIALEKLRIISYPDPRLRQRCKPVERFDAELARLAQRMIELMQEAKGVGLAAPQVGVLTRLFVCKPVEEAAARAFVNPVLTLGEEEQESEEGCLSIADVTVNVRRATQAQMAAFDLEGRPIKLTGDGFVSRIWQHEADHLDGRLIIERMTEAEKIKNRKLLKELEREYEQAQKKATKRRK